MTDKVRRYRIRLLMRSALNGGRLYRVLSRGVSDRFNSGAPGWDEMVGVHEHKWFDPLDAALDQMPDTWAPGTIIDVGGGTGRASYHLAGRYPAARIVVLDLAPQMLVFGRNRQATASLPPVSFVAGDSVSIPLRRSSADLAFVLNAPANAREMARVLAPGGVAVLAFTYGHHTPMYLDEQTSRAALRQAGFHQIQSGTGGEGSWVLGVLGVERAGQS